MVMIERLLMTGQQEGEDVEDHRGVRLRITTPITTTHMPQIHMPQIHMMIHMQETRTLALLHALLIGPQKIPTLLHPVLIRTHVIHTLGIRTLGIRMQESGQTRTPETLIEKEIPTLLPLDVLW